MPCVICLAPGLFVGGEGDAGGGARGSRLGELEVVEAGDVFGRAPVPVAAACGVLSSRGPAAGFALGHELG